MPARANVSAHDGQLPGDGLHFSARLGLPALTPAGFGAKGLARGYADTVATYGGTFGTNKLIKLKIPGAQIPASPYFISTSMVKDYSDTLNERSLAVKEVIIQSDGSGNLDGWFVCVNTTTGAVVDATNLGAQVNIMIAATATTFYAF